MSVARGTSPYPEETVYKGHCEGSAKPQEQGNTSRGHILGTDRGESVEAGAVVEEGQAGHTDLAAPTVASASFSGPSPSPEMQGSGQAHADMGSPTKSAIELRNECCPLSQGGAHVNGKGGREVMPQRQFEVWQLLRECDYYHLVLCMVLTSVSGLFIIGESPPLAAAF